MENIKEVITARSVNIVRQTMTASTKGRLFKSEEIVVRIPSMEFGKQILGDVGTVVKATNRVVDAKLSRSEIFTVFPSFPSVVKLCAFGGPYLCSHKANREYLYCFCDSIADSALVKIKKDEFRITYKCRSVDEEVAAAYGIPYTKDSHLKDLSWQEYWEQLELKEGVVQHYRQRPTTDIPNHMGMWM